MASLQEKATQLIGAGRHKEAISTLKRMINYTEGRAKEGKDPGVDSWPFRSLASVYRRQKEYDLECEVLGRFLANPQLGGSSHGEFAREARMRLDRRQLFGPEGKGQCQVCSQRYVLERNDLGEWLCSKCRKVRQAEVRRRQGLKQLQEWGIRLPETASEQRVWAVMQLHGEIARYVGDVWYHLTGHSYKTAVWEGESSNVGGMTVSIGVAAPLPGFDRFVSSFLADTPMALRLARTERERTAKATEALTPEQEADPYKYLHVVRGKPELEEDGDYHLVVERLKERYGQYMWKRTVDEKPWWRLG